MTVYESKRRHLLFNKHCIESNIIEVDSNYPYLALRMMHDFGIKFTNPHLVNEKVCKIIASELGKTIPKSFYENPQDTRYFKVEELLIEQLVSYLKIEFVTGVYSENTEDFERVEVFKKALPKYVTGDEIKLRTYTIVNTDEADKVIEEIIDSYCSYTRPWGEEEEEIFHDFYAYYKGQALGCKENIISCFMQYKDVRFACQLDKKDVVKLSVQLYGDKPVLAIQGADKKLLETAFYACKGCPLSKKQAKYFNTLSKKLTGKKGSESNARSPYKAAKKLIDEGKAFEAAQVFAKNGSLLQRNLVWVLSRAKDEAEFKAIVDLVEAENLIVLMQLLLGLTKDDYIDHRRFSFYKNNCKTTHVETDYEFETRKSKLSPERKTLLRDLVTCKVYESISKLEPLGKVYIDEEFKKVAIPFNTSASGLGLDVLPVGSRVPITGDYIRTFCYWEDVFDIDASAVLYKENFTSAYGDVLYWGNYSCKPFGPSALCSGDCRASDGAEYQDFRLSELIERGYKYVLYTLNGYGGRLNCGEIYCGYQNKDNLETKAWDPKNIETQINVRGDSRSYLGFAIDLEAKEMIILNTVVDSDCRTVATDDLEGIKDYLDPKYLETFNAYKLIAARSEVVETPEEADIIFSSTLKVKGEQKLVRPSDVEILVSYLNK